MAEIPHITIDKIGFKELLQRLDGAPRALSSMLRLTMGQVGREAVKIAQRRVSGEDLNYRTGEIYDAIDYKIENSGAEMSVYLGLYKTRSARIKLYGYAQEFGANNVMPGHPAEVMTIPLPAVLDSRGVPRYSAPDADDVWDRTFWKESKMGNLILFGASGEVLIPLYFGHEGPITVKAKHYLGNSMKEVTPYFQQKIQEHFGVAMKTIIAGGQIIEDR
jgi:hypothetical protein